MPVEKDIDLSKPLSEADMRQMEADANRLEELAKKAHANSEKAVSEQSKEEQLLNDAVKKVEQLEKEAEKAEKARTKIGKSISEVNQLAEHRTALSNLGGKEDFEENQPFEGMGGKDAFSGRLKTGRTAFGTGQQNAPMGHILKLQADLEEALKRQKAHEKFVKSQFAKQKEMLGNVQNQFSQAMQLNANPVGFGVGKLKGLIGKGGIYGLIALAVIEMAEQIYEQIKALYAEGGPYDMRKAVRDEVKNVSELEHILDRRSGRVFFTSDIELHSGPANNSNTTRMNRRVIQFQGLNVGGA